jgi:hypothetical protein
VHPVEWSIGEAVGMLAAYAVDKNITPHAVREKEHMLEEFQELIRSQGIDTHWPKK